MGGFVSWPGALSLVGAAWLMLLARAADGEARALAGALCLDTLGDAAPLVAATWSSSTTKPPLVAVRGRVCASNPRSCELDAGAKAVIHEVVEEDIYLARGATGLVRAPMETRRELAEREWWLEDGSTAAATTTGGSSAASAKHAPVRVRVEGGRAAARLGDALEVRQEYRERQDGGPSSSSSSPDRAPPPPSSSAGQAPSPPPPHAASLPPLLPAPHHHPHHPHSHGGPVGVVQATLGWTLGQLFVGQRHLGTRKTERFLPVGAIVTVVGELARFGGGGGGAAAVAAEGGGGEGVGGGGGRFSILSSSPSSSKAAAAAAATTTAASLPSLVVRRPVSGPFYVTSLSPRQLHAALAANARTCRALAACFGVVGCVLIARKAARRLWLRHRQRQARERVLRAEAAREQRLQQQRKAERRRRRRLERQQQQGPDAGSEAGGDATSKPLLALDRGSSSSDDDDDADDEATAYGGDLEKGGGGGDDEVGLCAVCLTNSSTMVFVKCGHLCACAGCAGSLDRCPICRARSDSIRVYRT
jgi:hypothetical protein